MNVSWNAFVKFTLGLCAIALISIIGWEWDLSWFAQIFIVGVPIALGFGWLSEWITKDEIK